MEQGYFETEGLPKDVYSKVVASMIKEILFLAESKLKKDRSEFRVLDIGSGIGEYSFKMERYVKEVVGVEPYTPVFVKSINKKKRIKSKVIFFNKKIEDFNTKKKFDLAISLTTLEHMPQAEKSFLRVFSLLKKGGILYLTAPNKWWPFENHYKLFFLSWVPLSMANLYLRLSGRGVSYEDSAYSKSLFEMKKFLNKFPCKYEFILPSSDNVAFLGHDDTSPFYSILKKLGFRLIRIFPIFWTFSKGFIVIAQKI